MKNKKLKLNVNIKNKILKWNLPIMLFFFALNYLYAIGFAASDIETASHHYRCAVPYYWEFYSALEGRYSLWGYIFLTVLMLLVISFITLILYGRKISLTSFILLVWGLILPGVAGWLTLYNNIMTVQIIRLLVLSIYLIATVFFVIRDFIAFDKRGKKKKVVEPQ